MTIQLTPIHGTFRIGPEDTAAPAIIDGRPLVFPAGAVLACRDDVLLRVYPPGEPAIELSRTNTLPREA